jgi:hypothetical protein
MIQLETAGCRSIDGSRTLIGWFFFPFVLSGVGSDLSVQSNLANNWFIQYTHFPYIHIPFITMSATEATQSPSTKVVPSENILNDKV